jgi:hypothetical protein
VWHKGSASDYPLLAPGVFLHAATNTLRVYHNTVTAWDKHVDVPNVPVNKWFHLAVILKGRGLDVFVNGNLAGRMRFDTVPRLNTGGLYIFSPATFAAPSVPGFVVAGPAKGMVSRFKYFAYALGYAGLDKEYRAGPSTTIVSPGTFASVPTTYLADTWWGGGADGGAAP